MGGEWECKKGDAPGELTYRQRRSYRWARLSFVRTIRTTGLAQATVRGSDHLRFAAFAVFFAGGFLAADFLAALRGA